MKNRLFLLIPLTAALLSLMRYVHITYASFPPKPAEVGDTIQNFVATDERDSIFTLDSALKKGPVVLVFYRGQWCPYCNRHLSDLQDSLELVAEMGAQVVAISPEKTEQLQTMEKKTKATFTLLYDENYLIAKSFGVSFVPDDSTIKKYNTFLNADLVSAHQNTGTIELPVPATFIINQDYTIRWRHYDPDYKNRASVKSILENLPKIK